METKIRAESNLIQRVTDERQRALRAGSKRVRYTESLRDDIVQFTRAQKLSPEAAARRLGLSKSVVRNWVRGEVRQRRHQGAPRLERVEVIAVEQHSSTAELRLVFPGGAYVLVSLQQLRQLLRGEP